MKIKISKTNLLFILIGVSILLYILVKATISSFTHDESYTYLYYVHTSFMDIISFKDWFTNNHILNSLLMKYSEQVFGSSELSLRLPNLILFCVYMIYSFLLFKNKNLLLHIAIFLLLISNNALVDLFGLARGYGLSYGFMMMSLYHFVRYFDDKKIINIILFHAAALLAILSNFTILDFYLALLLIYNIVCFMDSKFITHKKFNLFSANKVHILPFLIVCIILYEPLRRVIFNSKLDFGGKDGFFSDTVSYLNNYILHGIQLSSTVSVIAQFIITLIVLIPFGIIMRKIFKKDEIFYTKNRGLIISNFLIILISIAIILQHILFKADFPIARFSLFLFPIFMVYSGFLFLYISNYYQKFITVFALSLAFIMSTSFVLKADFRSYSEWEYDMETATMIKKLTAFHTQSTTDSTNIKLGINWLFEPTINFYKESKKIDWLIRADRKGISPNDDFYYVFKYEINLEDTNKYKIIYEFDRINTVLVKNIHN